MTRRSCSYGRGRWYHVAMRSSLRRWLTQRILMLTAGLFMAGTAHGESASITAGERNRARNLVYEGDELRNAGQHRAALDRYREAHDIMGVPTTGIEVARTMAALSQVLEARTLALEIANESPERNEPRIFRRTRLQAAELADALLPRISTLVVHIRTQGQPVEKSPPPLQAVVQVDHVTLPSAAHGLPIKVNPGRHHVHVTMPQHEPIAEEVTIAEGDTHTLYTLLRPMSSPAQRSPPGQVARNNRGRYGCACAQPADWSGTLILLSLATMARRARSRQPTTHPPHRYRPRSTSRTKARSAMTHRPGTDRASFGRPARK